MADYFPRQEFQRLGFSEVAIRVLEKVANLADTIERVGSAEEALELKQPLDPLLTSLSALGEPGADKMLFWDHSGGQLGWLEPADNLAIDGADLDASAPAGGTWILHGSYDFAVDGAAPQVDFAGLAGAADVLIIVRNVALSVSGNIALRASINNGANFYSTSGDYVRIDQAGVATNADALAVAYSTAATAARSGVILVRGINLVGAPKVGDSLNQVSTTDRIRVMVVAAGVANDVDALRCFPTAGGNITGGQIYCLKR